MPKPNKPPTVTRQSNVAKPVKTGGALDRLKNAWDFQDRISINLYGKSGSGKTSLWATFPKPILAIVCSGGLRPGELKSIDRPEYRETIFPRVVESSDDVVELIRVAEGGEFQTVVLDHGSGLQDLKLKEILGLRELPAQLSWGLATQQQYGQLALQMKETFRALLNLPCNVVIVAQERNFNEESNDGSILQPYVASALSPSVVGWLNPAVDIVCQTYLRHQVIEKRVKVGGQEVVQKSRGDRVEYCLRTYPSSTYASKFRVPRGTELPECLVDPTYEKIMSLIRGE